MSPNPTCANCVEREAAQSVYVPEKGRWFRLCWSCAMYAHDAAALDLIATSARPTPRNNKPPRSY